MSWKPAAAAIALVAVVGFLVSPVSAMAASSVGGPISRSEVRDRAQFWVDRHVPYSQSAQYGDPQGRLYRTDCSGYVSMAWHLTASENTATLMNFANRLASYDDLQRGDAVDRTGSDVPWDLQHVALFDHWTDGSHTSLVVYSEPYPGKTAEIESWSRSYLSDNGYIPIRYKNIVSDAPQPLPVQVVATTANGGLFHTIRQVNGVWSGAFGDVEGQAGSVDAVAADVARTGNDLQLVAATRDGHLFHTARLADGSWLSWGNVLSTTGATFQVADVAAASVNNELNVVVATTAGNVFHAIRHVDGTWTTFGNVDGVAGNPGKVVKVSAAAVRSPSGSATDLHVVVATSDGRLWHTARRTDGSWLAFGDVKGQAGDPGSIADVTAAGVGVDLHVVVASGDGRIWHAARKSDGSWLPFGDVVAAAHSTLSGAAAVDAVGEPNGDLHLVIGTGSGGVFHTARKVDGTWLAIGDVKAQTSNPGVVVNVTAA